MSDSEAISGHFRVDFMWGTATASYQIEGAHDADGKSPSVWDMFAHKEGAIVDGCNGDISCDSYHNYKDDIELIKQMKNTHYRFSLSWSRLLPTADSSAPNMAGVAYYNKLIDGLLANGIEPCVTLFHWDLPRCLHDKGGWQDDFIIEKFKEYAKFCFDHFGDRVKMWITINEPHVVAAFGYGSGIHAPGVQDPMSGCYQVSRTMLLGHAHAWRLYDSEYRAKQNGVISITLNSDWAEPANPANQEDKDAADFYLQCTLGWFAHPVYVDGDYPPKMKEAIARKSKEQGLEKSRLPTFTEEEKKIIKGTHDFFGLNHYTSRVCSPVTEETKAMVLHPDLEALVYPNEKWERAGSVWLFLVPWGLRKLLNFIANNYGNPKIIITENGCSTKHPHDNPGDVANLKDEQRCRYIKSYLNEALKAHLLDGVDLRGYFLWSLMDNFEWAEGYTERFGLHHVDFNDPKRKRTPRNSAKLYTKIIEENGFSAPPDVTDGTI
ncbi:unnamed protein product [Clavelina lepadiformis]|uniref:Beta-glucosidase n=1 Tax=Clavelina lepadiformis TaxID=159417 RepID=A0ABP0FDM5_CLALP